MKKTKKLLTLLLATLIMLSATVVAFAKQECNHEFNTETLVRVSETEDAFFVCKKCGADVTAKPADFSEFFVLMGRIMQLEAGFYAEEAVNKIREFYGNLVEETRESHTDEIGVNVYSVFLLTEYEQDLVDRATEIYRDIVEQTEEFARSLGVVPVFNMVDFLAAVNKPQVYEFLYHKTADEFVRELTEEKREAALEIYSSASEILDGYNDYDEIEDLSESDIAKINGAFAKLAYIYDGVASCMAGAHSCEATDDMGNGKHMSLCGFCGKAYGEQEHIWGEYKENENPDPCYNKDSITAKCTLCSAENTIILEDSRGEHINEDGDDFCDVCGERVVERCSFCGDLAHKGYMQYICMLKNLISFLVGMIQSII